MTQRYGEQTDSYQRGRGLGSWVKKVKELSKKTNKLRDTEKKRTIMLRKINQIKKNMLNVSLYKVKTRENLICCTKGHVVVTFEDDSVSE